MGKSVALGSRGASDRRQGATLKSQSIAQIIQPNTVSGLRVEHRHDVAPSAELATLLFHASFASQLRH